MFGILGALHTDGAPVGLGIGTPLVIAVVLTIVGAALFVIAGCTALIRARNQRRAPLPGEHVDSAQARLAAVENDGEDLAQILAAKIEEKAERIERLLRRADERIARLEGALGDDGGRAGTPPARRAQPVARAAMEAKPASAPTERPAIGAPDTDALARKVYALADLGKTPVQIARTLNQPTGAVQLMLALRRA